MYRIKELREESGLNMRQASFALGMPYTTYVGYEKGEREPSSDVLVKFAEHYKTTTDYILGVSDVRNPTLNLLQPTITDNFVTFPVVGDIAAGYDQIAIEDWSGDTVDIPTSYLRGHNLADFFVLTVKGDSMYPLYLDGDKVLILKQSTVNRSGDVGAILYDGECATLKKLEYVNGEDWLRMVPINPNYQPIEIKDADLERCKVMGIPKLLIRTM